MPDEKGFDQQAKWRAASRQLRAKFESLSVGGRHTYEKGIRREQLLCEFLAHHLPSCYGVARGEVVSAPGQTGRQVDVVIYDALRAPLLQDNEASRIFTAESVYAAIELKPSLHKASLEEAVETISSAKALDRSATVAQHGGHRIYHGPTANPPMFGAVFALTSCGVRERLFGYLLAHHDRLPREQWLDCVCVLDEALIYHFQRAVDAVGFPRWFPAVLCEESRQGFCEYGEDTLMYFYLFLLHQLNTKELFPPDLLRYLRGLDPPEPWIEREDRPKG